MGATGSGGRPTPTALKKLRGNPGKRRLPVNEPQGRGDLWVPPAWFDGDQRDQWQYALDHVPPGLLTGTDRDTLAIWCVACVEYARAVQIVRDEGQTLVTKSGNVIQHPSLGIMNRQALLMLRAGREMGFSPVARAALGSSAPEFHTNGKSGRVISGSLAEYLEQKPDKLDS
jgi:P27 family predicted phage terminase small subunit